MAEEFEEFDFSDLYEDLSISTVTAGPNVTEYEVRLMIWDWFLYSLYLFVISCVWVCIHKLLEYEDYDNTTDLSLLNEYEYEEEDERYGPAEREREVLVSMQVTVQPIAQKTTFIHLCIAIELINIYFLFAGFTRERTKRRARRLWSGKKNTHCFKNMYFGTDFKVTLLANTILFWL